jgi:hypothetical protein
VTATIKTAKPKKLAPKTVAAPKGLLSNPRLQQPRAQNPRELNPHPTNSPLVGTSDLNLPLEACVELTRRLLIYSHPTGAARPRALLKTVILFVAEYGITP